jgi:putative OPT family oligopeptide transporter
MSTVLIGTLLVIIALWAYPGTEINILAIALTIVFGFFFIVVAARIVGIVGSSSSPVSGMTIATLLVTCLVLASFGIAGAVGMVTAMTVGAVVCISVCLSGDIAQDLKTGYLLGATPRKMQMMEFVGLAASALTMGMVLFLLVDTYGIVPSAEHPEPLLAPQANVMAAVVQGILGGELPWEFIIAGGMIALAVEFLGVSSLPFAIGLYLPLDLSTPIMCGGLLALMVRKTTKDLGRYKIREQKGVLFGSGIVAGDALIGVGVALLLYMSDKIAFFAPYKTYVEEHQPASYFGAPWGDILSLSAFGILMIIFWQFTRHNKGEI